MRTAFTTNTMFKNYKDKTIILLFINQFRTDNMQIIFCIEFLYYSYKIFVSVNDYAFQEIPPSSSNQSALYTELPTI